MTLFPLPAFDDNYIWVLHDGCRALVVDPGESGPLLRWLAQEQLQLDTILLTHHHPDHTGGVDALRLATGAQVFGPQRERLPEPVQRMGEPDSVQALGLNWRVIDVPGHTAGHIAYHCDAVDGLPLLFCGDTLFSAGCGRLFEGTPADMHQSLGKLAALPGETQVCCTHEYTLSNLRFALAVEPANQALLAHAAHCKSLRARNLPTLPSSIQLERQINPFLRTEVPEVILAASRHAAQEQVVGTPLALDGVAVLALLRTWKNQFS